VRGGSTINTLPATIQYGIMSGIGQILAIVISNAPAYDCRLVVQAKESLEVSKNEQRQFIE
jgi:hypothetical protein